MIDTYIVIPSYNEGSVLQKTIDSILPLGIRICVVDDCSTVPVSQLVKSHPLLSILRHPVNLGQGAALQTGTEYVKQCQGKYIVHFDADGQHPKEAIDQALNLLLSEELDVVIGSRFLEKEHEQYIPSKRRKTLKIARLVNFLFTGLYLTDAHNGFRVLGPKAVDKLVITQNRMSHATEIPALINKLKLRYAEIPTKIVYTDYTMAKGQTSLNSVNILFELLSKNLLK